MKWQDPGKNLFFWKNANETPYCGIKNPCSAENKSAFFEIVLSNYSVLKISIHTDDIDAGATLSEHDFRLSSKHWSHFTEHKIFKINFPLHCYFQLNHLTCTFPDPSILFLQCKWLSSYDFLLLLSLHCMWLAVCGILFLILFYIPCSLYHVEFFSCCYFNACE